MRNMKKTAVAKCWKIRWLDYNDDNSYYNKILSTITNLTVITNKKKRKKPNK